MELEEVVQAGSEAVQPKGDFGAIVEPTVPFSSCCPALPCQVEPNTKLFPAVFVLPTHQNVIQFELGKQKVRVL